MTRTCITCHGPLTENELLYHQECLDRLIRETAEEIALLEAKIEKIKKDAGIWPYAGNR